MSTRPDLILLHGFRGSPLGLKTIATDLENAGYRVFTPPVPPFGGAKELSSYTPEAYTQFLLDFIDAHHLHRPVLIGHSMGSIIAAGASQLSPDHFHDKLILLSPISKRPAMPIRLVMPLSGLLPARLIDHITTRFLFIPHDKALFQESLALTHACSSDHPPKKSAIFRAAKFSTTYAINDFATNFPKTKQVCLIAGEHDRLAPQSQAVELARKLHANTTFLPNSGHLHNYEYPHETAAAIKTFLAK